MFSLEVFSAQRHHLEGPCSRWKSFLPSGVMWRALAPAGMYSYPAASSGGPLFPLEVFPVQRRHPEAFLLPPEVFSVQRHHLEALLLPLEVFSALREQYV